MAGKPVLRNLLMNETKVNFAFALAASLVTAVAYKYGVEYRRQKKIDDFFKDFDDKARYERMEKAGVFKIYNPDDE